MDTITITLVANVVVWLLALTYFWGSRRHHPGYFSSKAVLSAERDATESAFDGILQLDLVRERVCMAVCARDRCLAGDGGGGSATGRLRHLGFSFSF